MMVVNLTIYLLLRAFIGLVSLMPVSVAERVLGSLIGLIVMFFPSYKRIAHKNLLQAFPKSDYKWRRDIIRQSYRSLGRLIADFARIEKLSPEWVNEHVEFPPESVLEKLSGKEGRKGVLFVTGHLGSFELLAHAAVTRGFPISFVVRNFKNPYLDRWWNGIRAARGNRVISRRGAFNEVIAALNGGTDTGILFDQNVKRKHAVFVDFFGREAATTKTVGYAALKTECRVMVVSIKHKGDDYYTINLVECDFEKLYNDPNLGTDEKVLQITRAVSREYEEMIRQDPGAWFWMHRRWKTAPEGKKEEFYS